MKREELISKVERIINKINHSQFGEDVYELSTSIVEQFDEIIEKAQKYDDLCK